MVFDYTQGTVNDIVGQTFEIPLTYPGGINLEGTIIKYEDASLTIRFGIYGEINSLPLIWEQTVISINGQELFVLPAYKTSYITTKGYPGYYEEDEDTDHGLIIDDGGNTQGDVIIDDGGNTGEVIIDDGGNTQEEHGGGVIDDGGNPQEEHGGGVIDDGGNTQEEHGGGVIDDGGNEQQDTETSYGNATIEETPITYEDATTKSTISISFRQLSGFSNINSVLTFYFYALSTTSIPSGSVITLYVNLIGKEGMEENATAINCTAQEDYSIGDQLSIQAIFICSLEDVDETQEYTSLRLNSSNDITGIPTEDETALNPSLTDQSILNNEIKDCSTDSSVPPTFTSQLLQSENCETNGQFSIIGELSENKTIAAKFTIPLTFPEGTSISCTYEGGTEIICVADKTLNGSIVIEKTMITSGNEELFVLTNITSELSCGNGLEIRASQKINVDISFRQVSHIEKATDTIYFFFAAFVNTNLNPPYSADMRVILSVLDHKVEKYISCTLMEEVVVTSGQEQGDFNCSIPLESSEELDIPVENVTVSTNNDLIGGCAELTKEEASPYLTDVAISNNDNAESELAYVNDYYIDTYKNLKPPSLRISSFDLSRCATQGKIKLIGSLSQAISEQIVFELPFSYPSSSVKCTIDPTDVINEVDIICKILKTKKFGSFRSFVVEPRLLKKKRKEILFIESSTYDYGSEMRCENFNDLKLKLAKARKASSTFSFLQIARTTSSDYMFFMALTRKSEEISFTSTTFEVSVIVETTSTGRLRSLDQTQELDRIVTCDVGATTGNSGVLNCRPQSGGSLTPRKINFLTPNISGIPEDAPVPSNPNPDYSKNETLKIVDGLPIVTITNVSSNNCSANGSFVIDANSTKQFDWTSKTNISISFSTPDSSGLCKVNVLSDKRTLKMDCENTESFTASEIIIGSQIVYDDDDVTQIFRISQDYTAPVQFACLPMLLILLIAR